jgi:hypothetical protein
MQRTYKKQDGAMTAAPIPPARLAKLLPLLGSDQPGEVTAAAAALQRVLAGAGMDLMDLANLVATEAQRRQRPAFSFASLGPRGTRKQLAMLLYRAPKGALSNVEREQVQHFYDALAGRASTAKLTGDALTATDDLWRRVFGGGA